MLECVVNDFLAIPGAQVCGLRDGRLAPLSDPRFEAEIVSSALEEEGRFRELATLSDYTLIIAPEFKLHLARRASWAIACGAKLLGPGVAAIEMASNKGRLAKFLARAGVPVPRGRTLAPGERIPRDFPLPAVIKPNDGCGSQGVRLLNTVADVGQSSLTDVRRIEAFVPGLAASVLVLSTRDGRCLPLSACTQRLSQDGQFTYLGGGLPLQPDENQRAQRLAMRTIGLLPEAGGYMGVDLMLGGARDGGDDVVIEVNPRLTTSYVGLRIASRTNLAQAMLAAYTGEEVRLSFADDPIEFDATGRVTTVH